MTTDRISIDRRTEILEAAIRVLARDGLAQASTRKLAAEAGINQATLLYHVGSKDELLQAAAPFFYSLLDKQFFEKGLKAQLKTLL